MRKVNPVTSIFTQSGINYIGNESRFYSENTGIIYVNDGGYVNFPVQLRHLFNKNKPYGGLCIATTIVNAQNKWIAGFACVECSPKDLYDRKYGREIAMTLLADGIVSYFDHTKVELTYRERLAVGQILINDKYGPDCGNDFLEACAYAFAPSKYLKYLV